METHFPRRKLMYRSLLLAACMVASVAQAKTITIAETIARTSAKIVQHNVTLTDVFNVGDIDNYSLSVAGMKGTMIMKVTAVTPSQLTIEQDMSIMGQNQTAI